MKNSSGSRFLDFVESVGNRLPDPTALFVYGTLLVMLASNPGKTYSRSDLLSQVWGVDFEGFEHTVNSHINRLRSKIEKNMNQPEFIQTTWGVGYKFKDEGS